MDSQRPVDVCHLGHIHISLYLNLSKTKMRGTDPISQDLEFAKVCSYMDAEKQCLTHSEVSQCYD